jgi:exonuclease III
MPGIIRHSHTPVQILSLMSHNLIIGNVHGLNDLARRVVCGIVRSNSAVVVCIQETKLQVIDLNVVQQCRGSDFTEFCFAPADGTRGGTLAAVLEGSGAATRC